MTDDYRELLIGCGRDRRKRYSAVPHHPRGWQSRWSLLDSTVTGPVTLDVNIAVNPDIWCDLNQAPPWHFFPRDPMAEGPDRIFFKSGVQYSQGYYAQGDYWDEIHAYQVLEHLGRQGDAHSFFKQFEELWRILKPGGYLVAEVPSRFSGHFWGDPGHTRAIVAESLTFLDQSEYQCQIDGPESSRTTMTDYRSIYKADFRQAQECADNRQHFVFVLQAVKPSRWVVPIQET